MRSLVFTCLVFILSQHALAWPPEWWKDAVDKVDAGLVHFDEQRLAELKKIGIDPGFDVSPALNPFKWDFHNEVRFYGTPQKIFKQQNVNPNGLLCCIQSAHSGKFLHVHGASMKDGAEIWQWDMKTVPEKERDHFMFIMEPVDINNSLFKIRCFHSGKYLHVHNASKENRAEIQTRRDSNMKHLIFRLEHVEDGEYIIGGLASGKYWHIANASKENRGPVWQWTKSTSPHFRFHFIPMTIRR